MNKTLTFSPFTRVEGDLRIEIQVRDGAVTIARTSGTLFRGFELMARGRDPRDAIVLMCRICGQCGASHSRAATAALADAYGTPSLPNGVLAKNVIHGVEWLLSHLAQFYLSFAADLAGKRYGQAAADRFAPMRGRSLKGAVRARQSLLAVLGLFAGKWPNTLAMQPGGTTKTLCASELTRAQGVLTQFREFLETQVLGGPLSRWLENSSVADLERWLSTRRHAASDMGTFIRLSLGHGLDRIGRGPGRFLSMGGPPLPDGGMWLRDGYYEHQTHKLNPEQITEQVKHSWLAGPAEGLHPSEGVTRPEADKEDAYSWCKAPRYDGKSVEVGPLARMVIDEDPLIVDVLSRHGPGVYSRVLARLHEVMRLSAQLAQWVARIDPEEPFYVKEQPRPGRGCGLVEAPRGALGHWTSIEDGRIRNYQVITPTSWNVSPRDSHGQPGPVEEALVGTPVADDQALDVAHVVRSYDPCLFCTVH